MEKKFELTDKSVIIGDALKNRYKGKKFSILGDSVSTLAGYNPQGYNVFYEGEVCEKNCVRDMKDTWWGQVIEHFGGRLLVNNSWSGSRVSRVPKSPNLFPSGCSDERVHSLHVGDERPDVIIIYLGTNDWAKGTCPCLSERSPDMMPDWEDFFETAYDQMLKKIASHYRYTEIWCCTLSETKISGNESFAFPHQYGGYHIER